MKPTGLVGGIDALDLSVLSVEPYGMKLQAMRISRLFIATFSALGRAVWDETIEVKGGWWMLTPLSVLSVEPYGMKPTIGFTGRKKERLSVLSVEPYGMKLS